ncbi:MULTISPECIES: metallothiol transferase FosB [unclassified Paenibacillus]|uniref:metallothiol transferase FosB n=1 Tax=unclassified Paenibacillus TaxID=185978 RepID=UPI002404B281|nr:MULTISPECIES: metallothiol transferase FosB [unclassified Paenibacillus]MDF9841486.1 metallothiol transferase [Paenibacillus sp. PastF-2]MDF9848075.1 metallothiol transferase [Paenibacillus sp. PastM-2]MDH6507350.1 metallothiol transferase [Paenibacillus sp. PastM-3]
MNIQGINHFCFSVSDLDRSIKFYSEVFGARILVKGRKLAYFDLNGLWIALNQEDVVRDRNNRIYTHIAFTIDKNDYENLLNKLKELHVEVLPGRVRDARDKESIYFYDPDGHLFEFHTGTLQDRLDYYRAEKEHMIFYDEEGSGKRFDVDSLIRS